MPRSEMLGPMNGDGSLFDNARANAVRALYFLGPHAAEPRSPKFETRCLRAFTAMVDCDARAVTEQDRITSLPNHLVELIDFLISAEDELIERLAKRFQFTSRED